MSYDHSFSRSHNSPIPLISTHSTSSSSASSARQNQGQSEEQLETYPAPSPPYISPYPPVNQASQRLPAQQSLSLSRTDPSTYLDPSTASMSAYSSASDQESVYSSPGPQDYQVVTASMTANPRNLSSVCYLASVSFQFPFNFPSFFRGSEDF